MSVRHIVVDVFLWLGVALTLIGCLGVVLMRSVYDRLHFTSPTTLGAACIAVAVVVQKSFSLVGDKSILIAVLLIALSPLLTHATGRAARVVERGDWRIHDDEADAS
ncbi:MAG TPA: monovalent cation/H(+) antiporter subunit G [Solirubrobacteraceae bacterium]|jgi:monovalent cation/proton antiporter MnhG/PhaG subunit|nr:monovalent cation/H(+) antiporter subunit G [Solirubrobacteraceae bacterium]